MNPYVSLLIFLLTVSGFVITLILLASWLGPKFKTPTKELPWECGSVSVGNVSEQRFNVRFYLIAMLFILFDVEVIFMYPWAIDVEGFGWNGLAIIGAFSAVIFAGFIYVLERGVLDWNKD